MALFPAKQMGPKSMTLAGEGECLAKAEICAASKLKSPMMVYCTLCAASRTAALMTVAEVSASEFASP